MTADIGIDFLNDHNLTCKILESGTERGVGASPEDLRRPKLLKLEQFYPSPLPLTEPLKLSSNSDGTESFWTNKQTIMLEWEKMFISL